MQDILEISKISVHFFEILKFILQRMNHYRIKMLTYCHIMTIKYPIGYFQSKGKL